MSILNEIGASFHDLLWSTWSGPLAWSTILWSALGLVVVLIALMIGMSISMHYRLKQSFPDQAGKAPPAAFAASGEKRFAQVIGAVVPRDAHGIAKADIKINS